jgi:hypothetical protein
VTAAELAESTGPTHAGNPPHARRRLAARVSPLTLVVAAVAVAGVLIRIRVATQSIFADELSTYWISATHGLGGVLSLMYGTGKITHAEITPPLSFLASWLTTRVGQTPFLLRVPELVAGALTIPVVYALARRTVGRSAALVAASLTALSPFMIYYSAEARAYGMMMLFVLISTLAMLLAVETGRRRWWVIYAVSSCAAFYTHYTCAFVLAVQFLWLVWARPEARRPALIANVAAAAGVLPWITGLMNDFTSPTLNILSALSPFTAHEIRLDLEHWAIGYPYTTAGSLRDLPGTVSVALLGLAAIIAAGGLALAARVGGAPNRGPEPRPAPAPRRGPELRARLGRIDRRLVLMLALALAVPLGEAAVSLTGNHIFGVRNLAASWPYLAIFSAAVLTAGSPRIRMVAGGLAVLAFAFGAVKMLSSSFQRPDYQAAANVITRDARPGDVVIDETGALSPGPLTALDVLLHRRLPVFRAQAPAERDHPFGFSDPILSLQHGIDAAVTAAHGHRVLLIKNSFAADISGLKVRVTPTAARFPARYHLVALKRYRGIVGTTVYVYAVGGA